ncbi:MAG TPA: hypothetical protein VFU31_06945 [Candidatus Binatia bacterium]|nr:hypothetical protein [Candidatus Binatia bacterium]
MSVYGFFLALQINLTFGDLGRHLKNGELFIEKLLIANANLYSFAYPDYLFINHHWGSGVVFYLIEGFAGFSGLSVAFIAISLTTLLVFLNLACKYSSFALAAPIAVIVIPVLITRHEVRPEVFSYFFSGLFLQVLWGYKSRTLRDRWLFLLPILEILWVNLHIYFFIGVVLIAVFLFELVVAYFINNKEQDTVRRLKKLAGTLVLTLLATCVNPAGISGAIYPFLILKEYEFPVIENYSIRAVLNAGFRFLPLPYFEIVFGLLCLSWLYAIVKNRSNLSLGNFVLSLIFSAMAWWAIRNLAFFAYFALPLAAVNLKGLVGKEDSPGTLLRVSVALVAIAFGLVAISPIYFVSSHRGRVGIGLEPANHAAAEFLLKQNIRGPIFNNYDVGGYLIYHLYPRHRVFVDNRPEAYPASFFSDVYFPLQIDEEKWQELSHTYGFNMICFNHRDRSVWAERFIVRRVLDPAWAPVFMDKDIIVLLKRYGPNQSVIETYELPKERVLERSN